MVDRITVEINERGKWLRVPALQVGCTKLIVRGRLLRIAFVLDEDWLDRETDNPDLCLRALKEEDSSGVRADLFTFAQKPPATTPRYQYPLEWQSTAVVRTSSFKGWWEKLPQATRKNVRRAQKHGVVVRVCQLDENFIKGLVELNNDSPFRQRKAYLNYGKTFEQVQKDQSTFLDRSEFVGAYFKDELIGYLKIVYRGEIASILQFLPKASHRDKRPANALIAKAVELCESKGIPFLTYGLFNYGNKGDCPLREFKIRNGFEEMLVPRFYVPLSLRGSVCLKMKLHLGLIGILPSRLIALSLGARDSWLSFWRLTSRRGRIAERKGT